VISVSGNAGYTPAPQPEVFEVRIDYNNNGSFLDVGELVHSGSITAGTMNTLTANITIPTTLTDSQKTELRKIIQ
jgi:hypothetical protein